MPLPPVVPPAPADFSPLPPVTLVLGGARSGKSRLAEAMVRASGAARATYVATAQAWDDEMAERISVHRERRDAFWRTVEEPLDLAGLLPRVPPGEPVLVDCLTLWLTNQMLSAPDIDPEYAIDALIGALGRTFAPLVLVSNEVGLGIVPDTPLGRSFRDLAGRLNQMVSEAADRVIFTAAGVPLILKNVEA
ncbi:bifunctional adenosylcobinamide kinase/adenosylcobinamide-phosphate guanylyltransferase [Caenispirillum bisanense]|uniref:Bifunctional adenosylcobalamin biosynthesis protein n=1 Tax=Caenispirillum bisanense TaxID=414052 RepID=A0A286GHV5_9PROT|nr:bifunctional adenosylcobinamide kinase/adenosylcobinamide-phosphate guanylyltransferase [Caenispirillum bisanense]SOD95098.1 adenosylcobinamide kinase /adenosylcobinamide-phosphate guanylyltransferase [Caenispirillum bisanense]